jgi:hypothetical protein
MNKINLSLILVSGLLVSTITNANWSDAADKTGEAAKEVGNAVSESSSDAWVKTKEVSSEGWDKTKEVSEETWKGTKSAVHDGADYISEKTK